MNFIPETNDKSVFERIPVCNLNEKTDFSKLTEYLINQNDDYVNGIFYMLKSNNYNRPIIKKDKRTSIDCTFQDFFDDINRRVVFHSNPQVPDPLFIVKPNQNVYRYFHPLFNWKYSMCKLKMPIGQYMTNPQHFFLYCFHFFKKMMKDLINSVDFNEWCLSSEIPKASDVISDAIFDAVDVQSYFEPELGCLLMIISKLPFRSSKNKSSIPYVFENGLCVEIIRLQNFFSYKIKYRDYFFIESINDSINLHPDNSLCIHFMYHYGCNIIFNDQSILFDDDKLILIESDGKISYITIDGIFVSKINDITVIDQYGTISQKSGNKWVTTTENLFFYINGKKVESKFSYTIDYRTRIKSIIRPDQIEYYICPNGTRRILFNNGISIEQRNPSNIIYEIPNFPLITLNKGSFSLEMNDLNFIFAHNKISTIKNNLFQSNFDGEQLTIDIAQSEKIVLKQNECNVKSSTTTFHADSHNLNDLFESSVSRTDIKKKFPLRFFAIRSDFSGVEFVRKDSELLKDAIFQTSKIPHPYGGPVTVLGAHFADIKKDPFIFVENLPIKFPDDENELSIIFNGEDESVKIECDRRLFVSDNIAFARLLESFLENENVQTQYVDIADFNEEVELPMPFNTPSPRLQNMQYNLHQEKIKDLKKGCVLNYFKSHEADFALIDNEYEVIEEEEEEEEENEKLQHDDIETSVNFNLKQYEISAIDIEYTGQNIINDVPPPPFQANNDK